MKSRIIPLSLFLSPSFSTHHYFSLSTPFYTHISPKQIPSSWLFGRVPWPNPCDDCRQTGQGSHVRIDLLSTNQVFISSAFKTRRIPSFKCLNSPNVKFKKRVGGKAFRLPQKLFRKGFCLNDILTVAFSMKTERHIHTHHATIFQISLLFKFPHLKCRTFGQKLSELSRGWRTRGREGKL